MKKLTASAEGHMRKEVIRVRLLKTQARFARIRNPEGRDSGVGEFLLLVEVAAQHEALFVPLSIASGKKPTGFVYHIEGTGQGALSTATISCTGQGVTQITLGTIVYTKIPAGKAATFRILVTMQGFVNESYGIVINKIHYKSDPSDARYQKCLNQIPSKVIRFQ